MATEYRVTFGIKYDREVHPTLPVAHPDGWLTVYADNEMDARQILAAHIGSAWAFIYLPPFDTAHWARLYPRGELHHMGRVPEGVEPVKREAEVVDLVGALREVVALAKARREAGETR